MPQQQARMQPARAISYDAWTSAANYKPVHQQTYTPFATPQGSYVQNTSPLSTTTLAPGSSSIDSSFFQVCDSPENDVSDLWSTDFGLGLGSLGTDFDLAMLKKNSSEKSDSFPYPALVNDVETLAFDPGSPDGKSWSSLSESSGGLASDLTDFTAESDVTGIEPALAADLDALVRSENTTPNASHHTFPKPSGHGRAESSPRHCFRTSPYPVNVGRGRSFSTGSVALPKSHHTSALVHTVQQSPEATSQHTSPARVMRSMSTINDNEFEMFCQPQQTFVPEPYFSDISFNHFSFDPAINGVANSNFTPPPECMNILQSSSPHRDLHEHHFAGSTCPPDLFGPLSEDQLSPPPEDMDCEESERPRAQELRFEGDMYTPRFVRGHGNKREGWCGICKPGRWLVLKNSAFWYDKSFSHGISAATGAAFEGPRETRRMKGNLDVWEGLCGSCGDWIALISSKKKGTTWFRHAYKCHTHPKAKDTSKRRREVTQSRLPKGSKSISAKTEEREETPFSTESMQLPSDSSVKTETGVGEDLAV
ncbi:MAG: hypothetical protein Q9167_004153 [Letrouitia subvulpina]